MQPRKATRELRPVIKYLLLQIPGWVLAGMGLWLLRQWIDLSLWATVGLFLVWVIKDLALYPGSESTRYEGSPCS